MILTLFLFSLLGCTAGSTDGPPVARAGVDQRVEVGTSVTLDGLDSLGVDGAIASYSWTVLRTPANTDLAVSMMESTVTFTPDEVGDYTLALVVYDDEGARSAADVVTVTTFQVNTPPVAVATYLDGLLDGTDSFDLDGDSLTYQAEVVLAPTGALAAINPTKIPSQFEFEPVAAGTYVVGITVNDGNVDSTRSDVVVYVEEAIVNEPPVADAGPDLLLELGDTAPLDGSGSSDPEGLTLNAVWVVTSAPVGALSTPEDSTALVTTFTPDVEGAYTLTLTVDDGVYTDTDDATITATVKFINTPPIADAGADVEVCGVSEVTVDAVGSSDVDGDVLNYTWVLSSSPAASSISTGDLATGGSTANFTPDVVGVYTLTVTVDDGTDTDSDTVTITVGQSGTSLLLHMDETSGTTLVDSSPFGNNATASGGFFTGGRFFGAAGFDGGAEAVVPHDTSLTLEEDFTLTWWMEVAQTDANPRFVYTKGSGLGFSAYHTYNDLVVLLTDSSGVAYTLIASDVVYTDGWHHYALVVDGDNISLYSDGAIVATLTAPSTSLASNTDDLTFGSATGLLYPFEGALDEVVVYDAVLSASEVFDLAVADTQVCTDAQDVTSPVINIDGPTDGSVIFVTTTTITGSVEDASAIVDVTLNGWPVDEEAYGYAEWSLTMPVLYGANTYTVEATDIAGNVSTQSITVTYEDPVCEPDAVLVWTFESDEGDDILDSGALLIDAEGSGLDWVATPQGNGLIFDGAASAQTDPDSALTLSNMTVSFWLKAEDTGGATQVIVHNDGAIFADYGVAVSGTFVALNLELASGASELVTVAGAVDGTWHHLTFTFDGNALVGYVDGVAVGSNTLGAPTTIANVGNQVTLGSYAGVSSFFEGSLSQLRLFDFALTPVEVASRAAEGAACDFRGVNYALGAVATASSEYGADYSAENAIDGDYTETLGGVWRPSAGSSGWLELDLGAPVFVSDLRWLNINNSAIGPDAATTDYSVELSTTGAFAGEQWLIASGAGELEATPAWHDIQLAVAIEVQYLRFHIDDYTGEGGGLAELQVFGFL